LAFSLAVSIALMAGFWRNVGALLLDGFETVEEIAQDVPELPDGIVESDHVGGDLV
jgi:hypothetical protein